MSEGQNQVHRKDSFPKKHPIHIDAVSAVVTNIRLFPVTLFQINIPEYWVHEYMKLLWTSDKGLH